MSPSRHSLAVGELRVPRSLLPFYERNNFLRNYARDSRIALTHVRSPLTPIAISLFAILMKFHARFFARKKRTRVDCPLRIHDRPIAQYFWKEGRGWRLHSRKRFVTSAIEIWNRSVITRWWSKFDDRIFIPVNT